MGCKSNPKTLWRKWLVCKKPTCPFEIMALFGQTYSIIRAEMEMFHNWSKKLSELQLDNVYSSTSE